ncbi:UPF0462 protein C4orf33 homolog, partial [Trichonephila clavata]
DDKYLEVEFSPHGQHLLLFLSGRKNAIKMCLPVEYQATINQQNNTWRGIASIPKAYFPPGVNRFNAYAIHGSGDGRQYEALFPVPTSHFTHPDFHRLEFFRYIAFDKLLAIDSALSEEWKKCFTECRKGARMQRRLMYIFANKKSERQLSFILSLF